MAEEFDIVIEAKKPTLKSIIKNQPCIIKKSKHSRVGWRESFQKMAQAGDDKLLDEKFANDWGKDGWK